MRVNKNLLAIPCYNCERQIPRVIAGFSKELVSKFEKIIIIDNRSSDRTIEEAKLAIEKLGFGNFEIIKNNKNYLLGGTHKVAFLEAIRNQCTHLAILHGDAQAIAIDLMPQIVAMEMNFKLDATLATRFLPDSKLINYSKIREFGNRILNIIYSVFSLTKVKDLGGCVTIFRIDAFPNFEFLNFTDGFTFNNELLLYLIENKKVFQYFPITWMESDQVSNVFAPRIGYKMLKTLFIWFIFGTASKRYRNQDEAYYNYSISYSAEGKVINNL